MVAIAIVTFLLLMPPVFELVDRLAPGWLPAWIGLVVLAAIALVARTAERAPDPGLADRTAEPPA
ncbi:hypothetical protein [Geminicoccus flavidas]|uniref:hypothetical protein n=1 Tax=Geminicoccus flavidas TaxID=2506407 RepID=UPI00135936F4|nr:hypothetical protein [Geminicoccus flavidas]